MDNFYKLFEISLDASINDIIIAYKSKIKQYNFINNLNEAQIIQIKKFKMGLYILTNLELREKYNEYINSQNILSDKIQNSNKKSGFETSIGDRVFSLSDLNKRPGNLSDFELLLRNPIQGREEKLKNNSSN
jgi:DnaJ-class molecular chaperone